MLRPGAASGPFQVGLLVFWRLELGADLTLRTGRQLAPRLGLPQLVEIVGAGIRRQVAVVRTVVFEEIAHLSQARVQPEADANEQRIHLAFVGYVLVVRR